MKRLILPVASLLTFSAGALFGDTLTKANNADPLNTGTSWTGGVVPTGIDVAVWNNTVTAGRSTAIGGDFTVQGLVMGGATGIHTINNTSGAILRIGSSGIDYTGTTTAGTSSAAANTGFFIQTAVTLTANQDWKISNTFTGLPGVNGANFNQSEDLAFQAQALDTLFDLGGNTVTKSGAGTVYISSGYTILNGGFIINEGLLTIAGSNNRGVTIGSAAGTDPRVTIALNSGGTLKLQSNGSSAIISYADITMGGGTLNLVAGNTQAVTLNGAMSVTADSTISLTNTLVGNNSTGQLLIAGAISGTANLNLTNTSSANAVLVLGNDNTGFSGQWTIAGGLSVGAGGGTGGLGTGNVVNNGSLTFNRTGSYTVGNVISGSGTLTKTATGNMSLGGGTGDSVANSYAGLTTVNNGTLTLNKAAGTNAIAGNISLTGGTLAWSRANQIADTAGITITGGRIASGNIQETITSLTINHTGTGAFNPGSGSVITVLGAFSITGNNAATTNDYSLGSGSSATELRVGSMVLNDAKYLLGQNGNNNNSTLVLSGSFTGSGTSSLNVATGGNGQRQLILNGTGTHDHEFNISSGTTTIAPVVTQNSGTMATVTKTGDGTLAFTAANTYAGSTTVSAGTFLANNTVSGTNSATGTGNVNVMGTGRLGGTGNIAGNVSVASTGTLFVGTSTYLGSTIETLDLGGSLVNTGAMEFDLYSYSAGSQGTSDQLNMTSATGSIQLSGKLIVSNLTGGSSDYWEYGSIWKLISWQSTFDHAAVAYAQPDLILPSLANGGTWAIDNLADGLYIRVVPEPSRALLLAMGLGLFVLRRRR